MRINSRCINIYFWIFMVKEFDPFGSSHNTNHTYY